MSPSSSSSSSSNSSSSNSSSVPVTWFAAVVVGAAVATATIAYYQKQQHHQHHCRIVHELSQKVLEGEERRKEERTGRIRAEVKLRQIHKEKETLALQLQEEQEQQGGNHNKNGKNQHQYQQRQHHLLLQCIGTVVSPYTKRMGTPRQGSLVPSSRAFIELSIPMESLHGMEQYSHIWILFGFHANTNTAAAAVKTKVRPPRANEKVGQLATRSPHRPNPIGLSLVKMEYLDIKRKRLHISALDLVHGTPVYDIKPCVPWDIPGYNNNNHTTTNNNNNNNLMMYLQVPDWVNQKDVLETVQLTQTAQSSLQQMVQDGRLEPLYTIQNNGYQAALATLQEILAQDPRSSHKGLKVNQRGTTTTAAAASATNSSKNSKSKTDNNDNNPLYSLVFGKTVVEFQVFSWGVQVEQVNPIDFDDDAYVEGIPLISKAVK